MIAFSRRPIFGVHTCCYALLVTPPGEEGERAERAGDQPHGGEGRECFGTRKQEQLRFLDGGLLGQFGTGFYWLG